MKKTVYIAPAIEVTMVELSTLIANSPLSTVSGLDGVTKGQGEFQGGASDVKSNDTYDVWDDDWSR